MFSSKALKKNDALANVLAGIFFLGLGVYLVWEAQKFEPAGRHMPMFIGLGLIALSAILILCQLFLPNLLSANPSLHGSTSRRVIFVILMAIWIFALPYMGFLVSGFIMFMLISMIVPRESPWTPRGLFIHGIAGIVTTIGFWLLLTQFLLVPLPEWSLF